MFGPVCLNYYTANQYVNMEEQIFVLGFNALSCLFVVGSAISCYLVKKQLKTKQIKGFACE